MSFYETFSIKSSPGMDLEFVREFCVEMREMGWKLILSGCGDVVLLFSDNDYYPSIGDCEDHSFGFCVSGREWSLGELRRMKNL